MHALGAMRAKELKGLEEVWEWDVPETPFSRRVKPSAADFDACRKNGVFLRSGNTATYGTEAAILMGFRDIRLLGIDLRFDLAKSHFYGVNKHKGQRIKHGPKYIETVVRAFEVVRKDLEARGGTLTNETHIEGPLDSVLPRRLPRWPNMKKN